MPIRSLVFFSVVSLAVALMCWYLGRALLRRAPALRRRRAAVWCALGAFAVLQVAGHLAYRRTGLSAGSWFLWASYLAFGTTTCLFFYVALGDLASRAWDLARRRRSEAAGRRAFLGMVGLSAANVVLGSVEALSGPRVREASVPIEGLPAPFDGYRIVQLSDLHVGPSIRRRYVERARDAANGLGPDMVALTGDFIDGRPEEIRDDVRPLAGLRARDGVFFVTGNHEYYWDWPAWRPLFEEWGAVVLENGHRLVERGGARLAVAGIPDSRAESMGGAAIDLGRAFRGVPPGVPRILLAHRPHDYGADGSHGIRLQLSGHTHGGQYFPWCLFIGLFWKYHRGLYDLGGRWIYVNAATGFWGPPMRLAVPSEVTLITLRAA